MSIVTKRSPISATAELLFTGQMLFLTPNQQRQSTEDDTTLDMIKQEIVTGTAHGKSYLQKLASVSIF